MKIKKTLFFLMLVLAGATGFADNITLMNQTSYPNKKQNSRMVIQWATSTKEVQEANQAITSKTQLNPNSMQALNQTGKINMSVPKGSEYFRVLVWSTSTNGPDLLTNWVQVVPNKTYKLDNDYLVPAVLMAGTGC